MDIDADLPIRVQARFKSDSGDVHCFKYYKGSTKSMWLLFFSEEAST